MCNALKKPLIVILLTALAIGIKAQPYKLFIPNVDYLYADSANCYKGFKIVHVVADSNGDSIYYPEKEFNLFGDYPCIKSKDFSWISLPIITKPDGKTILRNFNDDSIIILTNAALNDSWTCYQFKNGNKIICRVTKTDTFSFLGIIDSVKTLIFDCYDKSNTKIPCNTDRFSLELSKNFGLLKTVNFSCFPDLTITSLGALSHHYSTLCNYSLAGLGENQGINNLTEKAIFDFQPGDQLDIFYYRNASTQNGLDKDTIKTRRIFLERVDLTGGVKYKVHETVERCSYYLTMIKITHSDTVKWLNYSFNDFLFNALPGNEIKESTASTNGDIFNIQQKSYNSKRQRKIFQYDYFHFYHKKTSDTCYQAGITDGCTYYDNYIEGLGGPYFSGICISCFEQQVLVYFKKGSETWGIPLSINQEKNINDNPQVSIFPNPWSFQSSIYINSTSDGNVIVYDNLGKQIFSMPYKPGNVVINLERNNYIPGMYFFLVVPKSGNPVAKKFVVE